MNNPASPKKVFEVAYENKQNQLCQQNILLWNIFTVIDKMLMYFIYLFTYFMANTINNLILLIYNT